MITTSITSSWHRALLALAAIALLGTSCQRELALPDVIVQDGQIVFGSEGLGVTVETKATEVTSLSSFYVSAVTGSAGSEASVWNSVRFSQVPGSSPASYTGGKYWPASNPGYKFYGSNVALNFAAEGTYVNASNATDVVCAYLSSPTYNTKNTLSFEHIFARLCRVDVAAQTGYTISNIQMYITPKTGGTYNLRTGAGHTDGTGWSSVATGSATLISNKTGATNNDIYMVPGVYQITCSWVSTDPSGASVTYTDKVTSLPIKGGATNNISVVLGGDIMLGVDLQDYCEYDYRDNLDYLTFYCDEAGTIGWKCSDASIARTIQYSKNFGATWTNLTSTTSGATVAVNAGDIVWFKGSNTAYSNGSYYNQFTLSNKAHVYGNVNSLTGNNTSVSEYCFDRLFNRCSNLYTYEHKKIILPATTLASGCYRSMFERCNYLTTAPELPATTLAQNCYYSMFQGCNSLTSAPALPATTLADYCYYRMFRNCASLTSAPTLPATTLANYCYSGMFNNCTSLTTAPALPATTLAPNCYESMFNYCTSLITAPELPSTTLANGCYSGMFMYCNSLTSAPALPATTLAESCYNCMFYGCTSLMTAPELPATTLAENCYLYMFNGCSSLNYIKALFTTDPSSGSYTTNWVSGVASTGTFVKSSAATWNVTGNNGVPTGWTVKKYVPGFSISATKKVHFAPGNLQATYNGSTWTWKFADYQWDYVGDAAGNTSVTETSPFISSNATVDLFGWVGASSTWTGVNQYGITSSKARSAVDGYGNSVSEGLKTDWGFIPGVVSRYGDGWYTLTSNEWKYVINDRASGATVNGTPDARYTEATINTDGTGVNGVILFPDGVTIAGTEVTSWGAINNTSDWATKCTTAQWSALESKGCVFLPAAGYRSGADVINPGSYGHYWSSTPHNSYDFRACNMQFHSGYMKPEVNMNPRYAGYSVRLVREMD